MTSPEEWLAQLREEVGRDGAGAAPSPLAEEEVTALLDLARIAAHASERWAAPVSTFVAGLAAARLPPAERARWLRDLADRLEGAGPEE